MPKDKEGQIDPEDVKSPSEQLLIMMSYALTYAKQQRHQFVFPETALMVLMRDERLVKEMKDNNVNTAAIERETKKYLDEVERTPAGKTIMPTPSVAFNKVYAMVLETSEENKLQAMQWNILDALYRVKGTEANRILTSRITEKRFERILAEYRNQCIGEFLLREIREKPRRKDETWDFVDEDTDEKATAVTHKRDMEPEEEETKEKERACRRVDNDANIANAPFYGRADDIRRSIITLLRFQKGHIIFVGDHGVGKTFMLRGLIQACKKFKQKSRIGGAHFYNLNPSAIVTGVSYTDEVENHVAEIIEDIDAEDCMAVVFADNVSELVPQTPNDNTPDTLRLLTTLSEGMDIHIVTTASFDQYKRLTQYNPSIEKYFTRIDIAEPKLDPDGRQMVHAVAPYWCAGHDVECPADVLDHIIDTAAASYTKDIAMPGRALDLLECICAQQEMELSRRHSGASNVLTRESVDALMKSMGYDAIASHDGQDQQLRDLEPKMLAKIFGQDEAVHGVAQSVLLAKAGLSDDTKPLAAYLFVGPTGVGKTELAKVLASELGAKLVRFDMSEYSEQHTVSKLVGSPAGYVGYDDGGLLTDAVRKSPNSVLLFDEIEKAHPAIFNLLLQVLDYAQLTDNKGQKADFSGTIIIMTSNAGARFATGAGLGFGAKGEKSEVMGAELKRVFAPEFLNRLTQIVAFHDMSQAMAEKILDRKVDELRETLKKKRKVDFTLTDGARAMLLKKGFSAHYGAREMDRAIGSLLKPALMETLLFGGSADGDLLTVEADGDKLKANIDKQGVQTK